MSSSLLCAVEQAMTIWWSVIGVIAGAAAAAGSGAGAGSAADSGWVGSAGTAAGSAGVSIIGWAAGVVDSSSWAPPQAARRRARDRLILVMVAPRGWGPTLLSVRPGCQPRESSFRSGGI